MDIREQIEKLSEKFTKDPELLERFRKNPVDAVKELIPGNADDAVIEKLAAGIKARQSAEKISDAANSLGKLFGKN